MVGGNYPRFIALGQFGRSNFREKIFVDSKNNFILSINFQEKVVMALLSQGILGGISGKIGNAVGSSWKGKSVIKAKALSVANPRSAKQVAQRSKMTNIVAFSTSILASTIKPLSDRFAKGMSGFNVFVQRNIVLFASEMPTPAASLVISSGKMVAVEPSAADGDAVSGVVTVEWPTDLPDSYAQDTDEVFIVCQNRTTGEIQVSSADATRNDGSQELTFAGEHVNLTQLATWIAFRRADGTVVSGTGYKLGRFNA